MSAEPLPVNSLALRKKLLIAESELNRAELVQDLKRVSTIATVTTGVGLLALILGKKKSASEEQRTPWWKHWMRGAGLAGTLWKFFQKRD